MHSLTSIQAANNAAAAEAKAKAAPSSSYSPRPNGDVLVAWHPPGQRRRSTTISGETAATFRAGLKQATTKTGKIPQRALDKLIYEIVAPAPKFEVQTLLDGKQFGITKRRDHDILGRKTLGPRKSKRFAAELAGITVSPERAPNKYRDAVSRLAATYFGD
jgi:hypothetical protein